MRFCTALIPLLCLSGAIALNAQIRSVAELSPNQNESGSGLATARIADSICQSCHPEIYQAFQGNGKARSFGKPSAENAIEDFSKLPYYHEPSKRYYEMVWREDNLWFRRYLKSATGGEVLVFEVKVDWVVGAGNQVRNYLYQTLQGELFQLPLAWYAEPVGWAMAAGYDNAYHPGVAKPLERDCLFCHNSYPDLEVGRDRHGTPSWFPGELPQGIGCQRCHGSATEHVAEAQDQKGAGSDTMSKLGELPSERRRELCYQCHYQPSHLISGIRRFGRGDFSYRPGEELLNYRVEVDLEQEGRLADERFEINHHGYRLEQSACFLRSGAQLECQTCHDPHRPASQPAQPYRTVCLNCHGQERATEARALPTESVAECSRPERREGIDLGPDSGDCVSCHMPKRRTQDVVRAVVTDHRIQRPSKVNWTAPLPETSSLVKSVKITKAAKLSDVERRVYSSVGLVRLLTAPQPATRLMGLLSSFPMDEPEPYYDLALALVRTRQFEKASEILQLMLARWPDFPVTKDWLALVDSVSGRNVQAVALLREAVAENRRPESIFNLGRILLGGQVLEEARSLFEEAARLRPNMQSAEFQLGRLFLAESKFEEAERHFLRSLSMDPLYGRAYLGLAEALFEQDKTEEAIVWLQLGEAVVRQADTLSQQIRILKAEQD